MELSSFLVLLAAWTFQTWTSKVYAKYPKYAKKIAQRILKKEDLKVGVIYNDAQIDCFSVMQQVDGADWVTISIDLDVSHKFPFTYNGFKDYLEYLERKHLKRFHFEPEPEISSYFSVGNGSSDSRQNSTTKNETRLMFKVNLQPSQIHLGKFYEDSAVAKDILERSQAAYFPLLTKFAKRWAMEGRTELILSNNLDIDMERGGDVGNEGDIDKSRWLLPYLYIQEVDVTPCQLRTMLGHTASEYSSIVVNEYTWSAFSHYASEMRSTSACPKASKMPTNPPSTYLFFTSGIGRKWNSTEKYFTRLLQQHQTISGWHLKTLVFSSDDFLYSVVDGEDDPAFNDYLSQPEKVPIDAGIPKFASDMQQQYDIGCSVGFHPDLVTSHYHDYLGTKSVMAQLNISTVHDCGPLLDLSSVIVWKLNVELSPDFTQELRGRASGFKAILLTVLVAREKFMKQYSGKEVVIQFIDGGWNSIEKKFREHGRVDKRLIGRICYDLFEQHNSYKIIQTWAAIHQVKVILPPAYEVDFGGLKGLKIPPGQDGSEEIVVRDECNGRWEELGGFEE